MSSDDTDVTEPGRPEDGGRRFVRESLANIGPSATTAGDSPEPGRQASAGVIGLGTSITAGPPADAPKLERAAVEAHLLGRDEESDRAWQRAHEEYARADDHERAACCAFWLGMVLMLRGEQARGGGWLARAARIANELDTECAAHGLMRVPEVLQALAGGDHSRAAALAEEIIEVGRRLEDRDVLAMGLLSLGRAELERGEVRRGMRLFDEVMLSVTTREVSPIPAGIVYCVVLAECMGILDMRRAAEWTRAFEQWCIAQPDLVPYRGQCLVHRSQVLQAHGAWSEAVREAEHARQRLSDPVHPALGLALYQQGELHRLRGEFGEAEQAYRAASGHGIEPAPGLALLREAEGKLDGAVAAIRRMVEESHGRIDSSATLAAAVEILLAAGDDDAARRASDELSGAARALDIPFVHAMADYATGLLRLGEGDGSGALVALRRACSVWRALSVPYEQARARVAIAQACRLLGDMDAADLELDAAHATFNALGARPDLARIAHLTERGEGEEATALTDRECEVLRLVATGMTNREIAVALVISEHTVARHLQNMFLKLGLSSRAAATAYAYEHGLT